MGWNETEWESVQEKDTQTYESELSGGLKERIVRWVGREMHRINMTQICKTPC